MPEILNDIHSRLNPTQVQAVVSPRSASELQQVVRDSGQRAISISGGRHAMGGQQFGHDTLHIDTRSLTRVIDFDQQRGLLRVQAGMQWPQVIREIRHRDRAGEPLWGIRQKQTGASDMTLGGAVAANVHGRGLQMRPFISDVEDLTLIDAHGELLHCSRSENDDWFRVVCGGYGLFGIVLEVTLRLAPRQRVQRWVSVETMEHLLDRLQREHEHGTLYGDFQFAIDPASPDFLHRGIFSRYRVVAAERPIPDGQVYFTPEKWLQLLRLARTDRLAAYRQYVDFYLATHGQLYDSDTHQLSTYVPRYHDLLTDLPPEAQGSEVISELYVPRPLLPEFMRRAAEVLRHCQAPVTYGTIRWIRRDDESWLAWARQDYACVIFNLLTPASEAGQARTCQAFRRLIDVALELQGSFYLTYHTYATRQQVLAAYPQMLEFLQFKARLDPLEKFQSSWYRHMQRLFAEAA